MNIVILGAASGMAIEAARILASRGDNLGLADIKSGDLNAIANDLKVRGAPKVDVKTLDLSAANGCDDVLQEFAAALGGIDALVVTYGILGDQARAKVDCEHAETILRSDFSSAALWLLAGARIVNPKGAIVVLSSVAGDRGRKSNYVYGAAKGGLALLAQGLAHDLAATGPRVVAIKPGFVITAMTDGMNRKGPLWASAGTLGKIIVGAIDKKRGPIVYAPWFWRWIMLVIRLVPASIFHKTNL